MIVKNANGLRQVVYANRFAGRQTQQSLRPFPVYGFIVPDATYRQIRWVVGLQDGHLYEYTYNFSTSADTYQAWEDTFNNLDGFQDRSRSGGVSFNFLLRPTGGGKLLLI